MIKSNRNNEEHSALCACDNREIGNLEGSERELCPKCARYAELLRKARDIYGNTRWAVTPEGLLQEIG